MEQGGSDEDRFEPVDLEMTRAAVGKYKRPRRYLCVEQGATT